MRLKVVIIAIAGVMTILLATLALTTHHSDPFARYAGFVSSHPTFKVEFKSTFNGAAPVEGSVLVERPKNRLLVSCISPGSRYTASSTEAGYVEIDTGSETYDESGPTHKLAIYSSRISDKFESAPAGVLSTDLKALIPPKPTITESGSTTSIHGSAESKMGKEDLWATVDGSGAITSIELKLVGMGGTSDRKWNLSYSFPKSLKLSDFTTPLPLGYEPYAFNRSVYPLQRGKVLPVTGWVKKGSAKQVDLLALAGKKPFLFALLDEEGPSSRARDSLKTLSSHLPVLLVGSDVVDPSGRLLSKINAPGMPTFFLADGSGKILKIWYGYDSDAKAGFEADVISTLTEGGKPKSP